MLKMKLYFGHRVHRADSMKKPLMLGKIEGKRRSGLEEEMVRSHHQLNGHEFEQTPGDSETWYAAVHGVKESDTTYYSTTTTTFSVAHLQPKSH